MKSDDEITQEIESKMPTDPPPVWLQVLVGLMMLAWCLSPIVIVIVLAVIK